MEQEAIMSMRICLQFPSKPGEILREPRCFDIPVLIIEFPRNRPRPFLSRVADAFRLVFSPSPEPWISPSLLASGLGEETIRDARLLATVNALTEKLSPTLRASLGSSTNTTAKQLQLPQGAEMTIGA
jgi:hypothetical protein